MAMKVVMKVVMGGGEFKSGKRVEEKEERNETRENGKKWKKKKK